MSQVVVDRVCHVVWFKVLFKAVLVDFLIFEGFHHYVKTALRLICIETYLESAVTGTATSNLKLIVKHKVQNLFEKTKTWVKNYVWKLWAPKNPFFHVVQFDIFETKDLLGVVVGYRSPLHSPYLHLHNVLQESTPDKIVELTLERTVLPLELNDAVV